jgi:hypothetical protein
MKNIENVDEMFHQIVESNVFSRKMLIQPFSEKCWLKKEDNLDGLWWAGSSHRYPPSGR